MVFYVSRNVLGVYAVDAGGALRAHVPFPREAEAVAQRLHAISAGELVEEEATLIGQLGPAPEDEVVFDAPKPGRRSEAMNLATRYLQRSESALAGEAGLGDLVAFKNAVAVALLQHTMHESVGRDRLLVNAVEALDVLDRSLNLLTERVREWYGVHFPELDQEVPDHERFIMLMLSGRRELAAQASGDAAIGDYARRSLGIDIGDRDVEVLTGFAQGLQACYRQRAAIVEYIDSLMGELAPNLKAVAGANLGARMIALSGTLARLARMPSSTIQILGAEKALFKHIAKGSPSPKHGVIFQHPAVGHAPAAVRGKIARAIAAKISLAAKVDVYSHEDRGAQLREALDQKVARIQQGRGGEA